MKRFAPALVALALLALPAALAAQEPLELSFRFDGVRMYSFYPTGGDLALLLSGPALDLGLGGETELMFKAGGGYQQFVLPRDPATGEPETAAGFNPYDSPNFQWELAFIQAYLRRADGDGLLKVFLLYRGRYDSYAANFPDAVFADAQGLFGSSLMAGASLDSVAVNAHRAKEGIYAELAGEWGPGFLNAATDFWRVSAQARGFPPLFDLPGGGGNLLNLYAAGFGGLDLAGGESVPLYVNRSFGGRELRGSLGDCVRGYESFSYDSAFKAVANLELRLVGPALYFDALVPVLYGFFDAGYFYGFSDAYWHAEDRGPLASTGGGLAIDLFGFAQIGAVAGVKLVEDQLYAVDEAFFWGLTFFLHF